MLFIVSVFILINSKISILLFLGIESLARMSMEYTQNNYRTQPTAKDVYEAFEDVGMTAEDLLPIINTNNEQISNSNFNTIPPSENMDELDQFKDPTDDFLPSDDEDDNNNGNEHVQAHQEAMVRMLELAPPFVPKMPPRHAYHRTPVYPTPHRTRTPIAHLDRKQNTSRLVERALKSLIERTQVATESSLINKNNEALKDNQNDDVENANTPLPTTNENSNNNNNNQGEENGVNKKRISEKPPWLNNINIDQNIIKELPLEFGTVNWAVIGSTQANSNSNNEPNLISSDIDSTNGNNHEIRVKRRRWKV